MIKRLASFSQLLGLVAIAALCFAQHAGAQGAADVPLPQAKPGSGVQSDDTERSDEPDAPAGTTAAQPKPKPSEKSAEQDPVSEPPSAAVDAAATASDASQGEPKPLPRPEAKQSEADASSPNGETKPVDEGPQAEPANGEADATPRIAEADAPGSVADETGEPRPIPRPGSEVDAADAAPGQAPPPAEAADDQAETAPVETDTVTIDLTAAPAEDDQPPKSGSSDASAAIVPVPRPQDEEEEPATNEQPEASEAPEEDHVLAALTPEEAREDLDCKWRLKSLGVAFEELEPLDGPGFCGIKAPIEVSELTANVRLSPRAVLNCRTAEALVKWVMESVEPAATEHLEAAVTGINHGSTYVCRNRNNQPEQKLSEHASGNAIDIVSIELEEREPVAVINRSEEESPEQEFQKVIREGACEQFTTVIGPGTNAFHETHFHFDMAQRNGGYRLCE